MRKLTVVAVVLSPWAAGAPLSAQSADAFAGWAGLVTTPVGAFGQDIAPPGPPPGLAVRLRYGHWQFDDDDDNTTNLGIGVSFAAGGARLTAEAGFTTVKGCDDCDRLLLGFEADVPLADRALPGPEAGPQAGRIGVFLRPAVGYAKETGDSDFSPLAAGLSLPLAASFPVGGGASLVPFLSPGVGWGRIRLGGDSESGFRAMLSGGVGLADLTPGLRITASLQKIFIDQGATVFGVALSYGR